MVCLRFVRLCVSPCLPGKVDTCPVPVDRIRFENEHNSVTGAPSVLALGLKDPQRLHGRFRALRTAPGPEIRALRTDLGPKMSTVVGRVYNCALVSNKVGSLVGHELWLFSAPGDPSSAPLTGATEQLVWGFLGHNINYGAGSRPPPKAAVGLLWVSLGRVVTWRHMS